MNWDIASTLAESIAAVAVIVSIVYLAVQIKHNTQAVETNTHQDLSEHAVTVAAMLIENNGVAELVVKGESSPEQLSPVEWRRFFDYEITVFGNWEAAFFHHNNGVITEELWQAWDGYYRLRFPTPGHIAFWKEARMGHAPSFRAYIDGLLGIDVNELGL
jgi:hypothetical protein